MAEAGRPGGSGGSALGVGCEALAWGAAVPGLEDTLVEVSCPGSLKQVVLFCVS